MKRPTPSETEDDILAMQSEWEASKFRHDRAAVQIHRMRKSKTSSIPEESDTELQGVEAKPSRYFTEGGRFFIDLDKITEEWSNQVLFDIKERNADWLEYDRSEELGRQGWQKLQHSAEDGFPAVLDLSAYYRKDADVKRTSEGKSFFAAEFDRIHGKIEDTLSLVDDETPNEGANYELENDRYLANLDMEQIKELQREISEKMAPKTISFLENRYQVKSKTQETRLKATKFNGPHDAKYKQPQSSSVESSTPPTTTPILNDIIDQLEVLQEFGDRCDKENYNRLAADAVQLGLFAKCSQGLGFRQQKNAAKLFDNCMIAPSGCTDKLLELARSRIDDIKELYLEEIKSGAKTYFQFAKGVNPLLDGSWMLVPVRRVLDAVHKRQGLGDAEACQDEIEIIRLALLWTVLFHEQRPLAFSAFADPNDMYVRLAEVLIIGPNVLADDVIASCYSRILTGYILKAAADGRLRLRVQGRIAELDAFMPFFDDVLTHFEQYSLGDIGFAKTLLIGAYLNSAITDSMECRFALWSPKRNTARQITIKMVDATDIMQHIRRLSNEQASVLEEQHYMQYTALLGAYAASIRDEKVTQDRNPVMFAIAAEEMGRFVHRHSHSYQESCSEKSKAKDFGVLVEIIRGALQGKGGFSFDNVYLCERRITLQGNTIL